MGGGVYNRSDVATFEDWTRAKMVLDFQETIPAHPLQGRQKEGPHPRNVSGEGFGGTIAKYENINSPLVRPRIWVVPINWSWAAI